MKEFNVNQGEGNLIVHLAGDNSNYTITYDHGSLIFENSSRRYIVPDTNTKSLRFPRVDPIHAKNKYMYQNLRNIYRDTTPTDFGLSNITEVALGSSHFTEEVLIGGINDKVSVIVPTDVIIHLNGNVVPNGTLVDNGDIVKFEITAPGTINTQNDYSINIGDISRSFSVHSLTSRKNCLEWLNAGQTTNGIYSIDPTGTAPFDVYCDMTTDGGGWTLLMNHQMATGYFANRTEAKSYNITNPQATRYSILGKMGDFTVNGVYEFRLSYPSLGGRNIWKQTLNPLTTKSTTTPVAGYQPTLIQYTGNYWGGIELNTDGGATLIDGSVNHTNWWFAIGATPSWDTGTTYPGPNSTSVNHSQLWVR